MPKRKTADDLKKELAELTKKYNEKVEAEKSAKIKAQMAKRGQMLTLIGLAFVAYISQANNEIKKQASDTIFSRFLNKYSIHDTNLTENQKTKRQKDQELLKEALQLAIDNKLK